MKDLIQKLIEQAISEEATFLDLGNCGLTAIPSEIANLPSTITHINFGTYYLFKNGKKEKSNNHNAKNNLVDNALSFDLFLKLSALKSLEFEDCGIGNKEANRIKGLSQLSALNVGSNNIGAEGALDLSNLSALTSLIISFNNILDEGIISLSKLVALTSLDISHNSIGIEGSKGLSKLIALTSLNVNFNNIGAEGAKSLINLSALTSLSIFGNNIGFNGINILSNLSRLTSLNISNNKIGENGVICLDNLAVLTFLDISFNRICNVGAKGLGNLSALTSLNIVNNNIGDEGAKVLSNLSALTSLNISNNKIKGEGAKALGNLTNLIDLDICENSIGDKGAIGLGKLSSLTFLNVANNNIGDKGAIGLGNLTNLTSLYIDNNKISTKGARGLRNLCAINELDISHNNIDDEGAICLGKLITLTSLYICNNKIGKEGAKGLNNLTNLTNLDISDNNIGEKGVGGIGNLTNLTYLDISDNKIGNEGAKELGNLHALNSLIIFSNNIDDKGVEALGNLSALTSLNICNNKIGNEGARYIGNLLALTSLYISDNKIGVEGALYICKCKMLLDLDISGNSMEDKGVDFLVTLPSLKILNLSFNNLKNIQKLKPLLNQLNSLDISGINFKNIPRTLTESNDSIKAVKIWLFEIEGNTKPNINVKLMINGNGNCGKSTLVHALINGKCDIEKVSTHGIEIEEWKYEEVNKEVDFHIWDFGGQEIFHGTHRLFMEAEAVWIIVFDSETEKLARKETLVQDRLTGEQVKHQIIEFWLDETKSQKQNKKVIVQSKKQLYPEEDTLKHKLAIDYNAGFAHVDSKTGTGINKLRSIIHEKGLEITEYGMPMPETWIKARSYFLENLEKEPDDRTKMISRKKFKELCLNEFGIRIEVIPVLLSFLHHSGVLFYNDEFLKDTIITDQRWALAAIYKPLDRESEFYKNMREIFLGRVRATDIFTAFGEDYSKEHKKLFINLMQSCGLCFELNLNKTDEDDFSNRWYIFPEFLPTKITQAAKDLWTLAKPIFRTFRFNLPYLNYYRIQAFIVKLGQKTPKEYIWRTGILLHPNEGLILIEASISNPSIKIKIEEKAVNKWLEVIMEEFNADKGNKEKGWVEINADGGEIELNLVSFFKNSKCIEEELEEKKSLIEKLPKVEQQRPRKLVVSYASEDVAEMNAIRMSLSKFTGNGSLIFDTDKRRTTGTRNWNKEIEEMFRQADGYLIIISEYYQDFETKEFIHKNELPIIHEMFTQNQIPVFCIKATDEYVIEELSKYLIFEGAENYLPADRGPRSTYLKKFINEFIEKKFLKL